MVKPFLKWVGGKSKLLPQILPHVPSTFNTYYEPFLGSGALFFHLQPKNAVLSDTNEELINCYIQVRDYPERLLNRLELLQSRYTQSPEAMYYRMRDLDRESIWEMQSDLTKAARFIFLNKTCFNGLYRVNKKGQFNVPWGKYKNPKIYDPETIMACSHALRNVTIDWADCKQKIALADTDDFIYCDPPYYVCETSKFNGYCSDGFNEHFSLYRELFWAGEQGVNWLVSNSDCDRVREIYQHQKIIEIQRQGTVSSKRDGRQPVKELLIKSF